MQIDCISEYKKVVKPFDDTFHQMSFLSSATDRFKITKHRDGKLPAVITISGFWSEDQDNRLNWQNSILNSYPENEWFHLEWNSTKKPLYKIKTDKLVLYDEEAQEAARRKANYSKFKLLGFNIINWILNNGWHFSVRNSRHTGKLLGKTLTACMKKEFILVGHSLGARVIHNCLEFLAKNNTPTNIQEVHLLGGAVSSRNKKWELASKSIQKKAYNYYSKNDTVLREAYAAIMLDDYPIGLSEINLPKFSNIDTTKYVRGHSEYIPNFHIIKQK